MERGDDRNKGLIVDSYSRHSQDWIVPRRVMCAFFWVGIILLFTGIILLVTSKHKGVVYQSWGAVLLGLGFCLLLICLILCLHAYCVITVSDEDDTPTLRRHVAPPAPALLLANGRKPIPIQDPDPLPVMAAPHGAANGNSQATLHRSNRQVEVTVVEKEQPKFRAVLSTTSGPPSHSSPKTKTRVLPSSDSFDNQCTCDINLDKRKSGGHALTQALDDVLDDIDRNHGPMEAEHKEQETPLLTDSPSRRRSKRMSGEKAVLSYNDTTNALQAYDAEQSYRSFNDDVDRSIDKDLNIRPNNHKRSPQRSANAFEEMDTPPVRFKESSRPHVQPLGPPPCDVVIQDKPPIHPLGPPPPTEPVSSSPHNQQPSHDGLIMIDPSHAQVRSPLVRPPLERQHGLFRGVPNGAPPSYDEMMKKEGLPSIEEHSPPQAEVAFNVEHSPELEAGSAASYHRRNNHKRRSQVANDDISEGYQNASYQSEPSNSTMVAVSSTAAETIPARLEGQKTTSIGVQYSPPPTPQPAVTSRRPPPGRRQSSQQPPVHRPLPQRAPRLWSQAAAHGAVAPGAGAQNMAQPQQHEIQAETVPLPDVSLSKISLYDNVQYDMSSLKNKGDVQHFHF